MSCFYMSKSSARELHCLKDLPSHICIVHTVSCVDIRLPYSGNFSAGRIFAKCCCEVLWKIFASFIFAHASEGLIFRHLNRQAKLAKFYPRRKFPAIRYSQRYRCRNINKEVAYFIKETQLCLLLFQLLRMRASRSQVTMQEDSGQSVSPHSP